MCVCVCVCVCVFVCCELAFRFLVACEESSLDGTSTIANVAALELSCQDSKCYNIITHVHTHTHTHTD